MNVSILSATCHFLDRLKRFNERQCPPFCQNSVRFVQLKMGNRDLINYSAQATEHNDVIKWKHFPHYWPLGAGNSPATGDFPSQRPVTRSLHIFFDLRVNNRLCRQSRRRRFEMQSGSLWRHCYEFRHFLQLLQPSSHSFVATLGHRLLKLQHGFVITSIIKCRMTLLIISHTLTVQPLMCGKGKIISSHTLLGMWLPFLTGMLVKRGALYHFVASISAQGYRFSTANFTWRFCSVNAVS